MRANIWTSKYTQAWRRANSWNGNLLDDSLEFIEQEPSSQQPQGEAGERAGSRYMNRRKFVPHKLVRTAAPVQRIAHAADTSPS